MQYCSKDAIIMRRFYPGGGDSCKKFAMSSQRWLQMSFTFHAANTPENSTLWLDRNFLKGCYISLERWFYMDQENWGCNFQKLVRAEKINPKGADLTPLGFSLFFFKTSQNFSTKHLHGLRDFNLWPFDGRLIVGGWPYPKLWGKYKKKLFKIS